MLNKNISAMYQELETERRSLPLLNLIEYLAVILAKTEKQRYQLQNECRSAQDILMQRSVKTLALSHVNDDMCEVISSGNGHLNSPLHNSTKHKVEYKSKFNSPYSSKAMTNTNKQNGDKCIKTATTDHAYNSTKINKTKENNLKKESLGSNANGSVSSKTVDPLMKQKYSITTCKRIEAQKERLKCYSVKNITSKPSPSRFNSVNKVKSIDDRVKKVTAGLAQASIKRAPGLAQASIKRAPGKQSEKAVITKRNSIIATTKHKFITFPQAITSSNFKCPTDLIKTFDFHQKLQGVTNFHRGINRNAASNFLTNLNKRNKYCLQSTAKEFEECSKWMKMKSRCSRKKDFQNEQIPFFKWETHQSVTGTLTYKMFTGQKSECERLILEMHHTEFLFLQLELLKILSQDVSSMDESLCYSTLFFKAYKALFNILPVRILA